MSSCRATNAKPCDRPKPGKGKGCVWLWECDGHPDGESCAGCGSMFCARCGRERDFSLEEYPEDEETVAAPAAPPTTSRRP